MLIGLSTLGILQTSVPLLRRFPLLTLLILILFGALLRLRAPIRKPRTSRDMRRLKAAAFMGLRAFSPTSHVIVGSAVFSVSYVAGFPRLLGAAIILMGSTLHFKNRLPRPARFIIGLFATALLGLSELARRHEPGWWLAVSNDATFFESISWSLAQNGPRAHPGLPEGTIFGYHYLAYAVSGAISELSGAPPYYILNVVLPLLLLTSLAMVFFAFLLRHTQSFVISTGLVVALGSILRVSSFTSSLFSNWAIAVYLLLLLELRRVPNFRSLWTWHQILLATVAFIAVFGKATALPVIVTLAFCSSLAKRPTSFERRPRDLVRLFPWHITPAVVFFITYYLPNVPDYSREGESSVLQVLLTIPNNEGVWQSKGDLVQFAFFVAVGLLAIITRSSAPPGHEVADSHALLMWISVAGAAFLLLIPNHLQRTYLAGHVNFVVFLLMLTIAVCQTRFVTSRHPIGVNKLFLMVVAIVGLASYFVVLEAPRVGQRLEELLQDPRGRWIYFAVVQSETLLPAVVVFTAIFWQLSRARAIRESPRAVAAVFSLPLCLVLCLAATNSIDHHSAATRKIDATALFDASHPDNDTSEVGKFLRESTPSDAIVASNSFCCVGTEWLVDKLGELQEFTTSYGLSDYKEDSYGGANYQLVSVSRRQFLLAGPRFIVMFTGNAMLKKRLEASVLFGATGSSVYAAQLLVDDADYFVVDRTVLGDIEVPTFEERMIFENSRYLVLDLER